MSSESEEGFDSFSEESDEENQELEESHSENEEVDTNDSGNEESNEQSENDESEGSGSEADNEVLTEDDESENPDSDNEDGKQQESGNAGWADAISKVLASTKPKAKKSVILARAKRDIDIIRTQKEKSKEASVGFEIEGEEKKQGVKRAAEEEVKKTDSEKKKERKEWDMIGRVKPEVLTNEKERQLSRISTKGVVQLFNAVRVQQKMLSNQLREAGPLERKREKVLKSVNKDKFMDLLQKTGARENRIKEVKKEVKDEPAWGVLRDDFMGSGNQLKDWDKMDSDDET